MPEDRSGKGTETTNEQKRLRAAGQGWDVIIHFPTRFECGKMVRGHKTLVFDFSKLAVKPFYKPKSKKMKNVIRTLVALFLVFTAFSCAEEIIPDTRPVDLDTEIIVAPDNEETATGEEEEDEGRDVRG